MTTVAIMQPTYLPWLGYFDLIASSQIFVFLDDVEFSRQSWQQRNRIKTSTGVQWLTVPVIRKGRSTQKIKDVLINLNAAFHIKHIKTIKQYYSKAPYWERYSDEFSMILNKQHEYLVELNLDLIGWFCQELGIVTKTIRSSQMNNVENVGKVERLVNICRYLGADHYLSPAGSKDYIDKNNLFINSGIKLSYQNYIHPTYYQLFSDFIPNMSAIDLLFNEGNNSLKLLKTSSMDNS